MQIGVIISGFHNPYFASLVSGIQDVAGAEGYSVMLTEVAVPTATTLEVFRGRRVDAVILAQRIDAKLVMQLVSEGTAVVSCGFKYQEAPAVPCVMPDHSQGCTLGVDLLVGLGHRKIALVPGSDTSGPDERQMRWIATMGELGLPPVAVIAGNYDHSSGYSALGRCLEVGATGVLLGNDVMAVGLLASAWQMGLSVPRDMSVVGYDGTWLANYTCPTLTTVDISGRAAGQEAARMAIAAAMEHEVTDLVTPVALVTGGSVGPPSAG